MNPDPIRIEVDGELFDVTFRDGGVDFDWVSGPNPDYGFSSGPPSVPRERTREELINSIQNFLAMVNPKTGYID